MNQTGILLFNSSTFPSSLHVKLRSTHVEGEPVLLCKEVVTTATGGGQQQNQERKAADGFTFDRIENIGPVPSQTAEQTFQLLEELTNRTGEGLNTSIVFVAPPCLDQGLFERLLFGDPSSPTEPSETDRHASVLSCTLGRMFQSLHEGGGVFRGLLHVAACCADTETGFEDLLANSQGVTRKEITIRGTRRSLQQRTIWSRKQCENIRRRLAEGVSAQHRQSLSVFVTLTSARLVNNKKPSRGSLTIALLRGGGAEGRSHSNSIPNSLEGWGVQGGERGDGGAGDRGWLRVLSLWRSTLDSLKSSGGGPTGIERRSAVGALLRDALWGASRRVWLVGVPTWASGCAFRRSLLPALRVALRCREEEREREGGGSGASSHERPASGSDRDREKDRDSAELWREELEVLRRENRGLIALCQSLETERDDARRQAASLETALASLRAVVNLRSAKGGRREKERLQQPEEANDLTPSPSLTHQERQDEEQREEHPEGVVRGFPVERDSGSLEGGVDLSEPHGECVTPVLQEELPSEAQLPSPLPQTETEEQPEPSSPESPKQIVRPPGAPPVLYFRLPSERAHEEGEEEEGIDRGDVTGETERAQECAEEGSAGDEEENEAAPSESFSVQTEKRVVRAQEGDGEDDAIHVSGVASYPHSAAEGEEEGQLNEDRLSVSEDPSSSSAESLNSPFPSQRETETSSREQTRRDGEEDVQRLAHDERDSDSPEVAERGPAGGEESPPLPRFSDFPDHLDAVTGARCLTAQPSAQANSLQEMRVSTSKQSPESRTVCLFDRSDSKSQDTRRPDAVKAAPSALLKQVEDPRIVPIEAQRSLFFLQSSPESEDGASEAGRSESKCRFPVPPFSPHLAVYDPKNNEKSGEGTGPPWQVSVQAQAGCALALPSSQENSQTRASSESAQTTAGADMEDIHVCLPADLCLPDGDVDLYASSDTPSPLLLWLCKLMSGLSKCLDLLAERERKLGMGENERVSSAERETETRSTKVWQKKVVVHAAPSASRRLLSLLLRVDVWAQQVLLLHQKREVSLRAKGGESVSESVRMILHGAERKRIEGGELSSHASSRESFQRDRGGESEGEEDIGGYLDVSSEVASALAEAKSLLSHPLLSSLLFKNLSRNCAPNPLTIPLLDAGKASALSPGSASLVLGHCSIASGLRLEGVEFENSGGGEAMRGRGGVGEKEEEDGSLCPPILVQLVLMVKRVRVLRRLSIRGLSETFGCVRRQLVSWRRKQQQPPQQETRDAGRGEGGSWGLPPAGASGLESFFDWLGFAHAGSLEELRLDNCQLGDDGLWLLLGSLAKHGAFGLQALSVKGNALGAVSACVLSHFLPSFGLLEELEAGHNHLRLSDEAEGDYPLSGEQKARASVVSPVEDLLASFFLCKSLRYVNLSVNGLEEDTRYVSFWERTKALVKKGGTGSGLGGRSGQPGREGGAGGGAQGLTEGEGPPGSSVVPGRSLGGGPAAAEVLACGAGERAGAHLCVHGI
uniref:Kinesin motor domain-containing protein n=1 Tax=Chromera velia CCMP2878 TaxID=1169474 RepID=A0A0G4FTR2_9ALVE|eukprot:Cvel_18727.t1-p1 / transcript=Cvel_18727.t1 / gene=Cvel_18727 / organism=Chromera_velia_CCMP2878 / gene_product=hypothetical protein / transcript_product=hypothetical protein / location=Cvel_scaffold1570:19092-26135(-) / protein_length=1493 / sequence_SO=supercontig / SO=protein_coding / is_pseudo=false